MRLREGRRWRDIYVSLTDELGHVPTMAEQMQLRQAATLALRSEEISAQAARPGASVDADELTRLCSELRRVLRTLGLGGNGVAGPDADRAHLEAEEAGLL